MYSFCWLSIFSLGASLGGIENTEFDDAWTKNIRKARYALTGGGTLNLLGYSLNKPCRTGPKRPNIRQLWRDVPILITYEVCLSCLLVNWPLTDCWPIYILKLKEITYIWQRLPDHPKCIRGDKSVHLEEWSFTGTVRQSTPSHDCIESPSTENCSSKNTLLGTSTLHYDAFRQLFWQRVRSPIKLLAC